MHAPGSFPPSPPLPVGNRVTIVIPSKNRRRRLVRTLATIRAQTHQDLEIIVSDDGSTDGTAETVRTIDDDRVRVIRSATSTGVTAARNRGLEAAMGDWVAVCDDDDLWPPTKIGAQLEEMRRTGTGWACVNVALVDDNLAYLGSQVGVPGDLRDRIGEGNAIPGGCSTVLAARSWFDAAGHFDVTFGHFADWDMWTRLARIGPVALPESERSLYVQHGTMMSGDQSGMTTELALFRQKHADLRAAAPTGLERVDHWIIGRMRAAGRRIPATTHALKFGALKDPGTWRSVASTWMPRRQALSVGPPPEAAAAIASVKPVIADHRV